MAATVDFRYRRSIVRAVILIICVALMSAHSAFAQSYAWEALSILPDAIEPQVEEEPASMGQSIDRLAERVDNPTFFMPYGKVPPRAHAGRVEAKIAELVPQLEDAYAYLRMGNFVAAERVYDEARNVDSKLKAQFKKFKSQSLYANSTAVGSSLAYIGTGSYGKAEDMLRSAIEEERGTDFIKAREYGLSEREYFSYGNQAVMYASLANLYLIQGRFDDAQKEIRLATKLYEQYEAFPSKLQFGEIKDPVLIVRVAYFGALGNFSDAEDVLNEIIERRTKRFNKEQRRASGQKKLGASVSGYADRRVLDVARLLLAETYRRQGKARDAAKLFLAIARPKGVEGEVLDYESEGYRGLGRIAEDLGKPRKAESYYQEGMRIIASKKYSGHRIYKILLMTDIARLNLKLGNAGVAQKILVMDSQLISQSMGEDSLPYAFATQGLGEAYIALGESATAKDMTQSLLKTLERKYGRSHPITARSRLTLYTAAVIRGDQKKGDDQRIKFENLRAAGLRGYTEGTLDGLEVHVAALRNAGFDEAADVVYGWSQTLEASAN